MFLQIWIEDSQNSCRSSLWCRRNEKMCKNLRWKCHDILEFFLALCKICFNSKETAKAINTKKVINLKRKQAKMVTTGQDRVRRTVLYTASLKSKCFKMGLS